MRIQQLTDDLSKMEKSILQNGIPAGGGEGVVLYPKSDVRYTVRLYGDIFDIRTRPLKFDMGSGGFEIIEGKPRLGRFVAALDRRDNDKAKLVRTIKGSEGEVREWMRGGGAERDVKIRGTELTPAGKRRPLRKGRTSWQGLRQGKSSNSRSTHPRAARKLSTNTRSRRPNLNT